MVDRILTFGGTGLVGSALESSREKHETSHFQPLSSQDVDITNKSQVREVLERAELDTILLLAAYTNVDGAEANPLEALRINVEGTRNVVQVADELGLRVIYTSTDFVFPGSERYPGPYAESFVPPNSYAAKEIGAYGNSKLLAERIVLESYGAHSVVRISYPFGNPKDPGDFIQKTIIMMDRGIPLFSDQYFTPTYIPDFASAIQRIAQEGHKGVLHVASGPLASPFEVGRYIAAKVGMDPSAVQRGSILDFRANFPDRAPRPIFGGLDTERTQERLGVVFLTWKEAVDDYFAKLSA